MSFAGRARLRPDPGQTKCVRLAERIVEMKEELR